MDELNSTRRKKVAAVLWRHIATENHAKARGGKHWRYLLVPDIAMATNCARAGSISAYTGPAGMGLLQRYSLAR